MSYQVIARKWRPQTFEEVTGQELITQTLKNAIEHDRLHHAYLFSGARGVGKTTTARLLAKALNCRKTDGPNVHPCRIDDPNACVSCVEIAESRSMDVLEFDAASNTQVEKIRDIILDSVAMNPVRDRYRVYIIDEVHQLSPHSFNALLKTLEEPPHNVVFIMATTELHKVPDTILSRTQEFEFRTIPLQKIVDRLKLIADAEKINISDEALREIARSGEGSMRDAQSNFDQVISFAGDRIEVTDVVNALGLASVDMLTRVLDAISENRPAEALAVVEELSARGQDLRNFCRDLLGLLRDLLVTKVGDDPVLCETSMLSPAELTKRSELFSESDLVRFFHSLADTEIRIKDATQPRYMLEIGLVKLVEMRRLASVESVLERLAQIERSLGNGSIAQRAAAAPESAAPSPSKEKKTLKSDLSDEPMAKAPAIDEFQAAEPEMEAPLTPSIDLEFLKSMPVRLPPIPSEELEHIEDQWLDDAYERKLSFSGDDLSPITEIKSFVAALVQETPAVLQAASVSGSGASTSAAVAMALSEIVAPSVEQQAELPVLGPQPTDQELTEYARAHPSVRAALKVFRGKIISVKRNPSLS
jgi:DNA polymerase-3 subunit gamma/tau